MTSNSSPIERHSGFQCSETDLRFFLFKIETDEGGSYVAIESLSKIFACDSRHFALSLIPTSFDMQAHSHEVLLWC